MPPLNSGSTKNGAPSWVRPGHGDREHRDRQHVPQTLGRPGRIAVAPSSAPVKAGSISSWPTVLWPTWSCACEHDAGEGGEHAGGDEGERDVAVASGCRSAPRPAGCRR